MLSPAAAARLGLGAASFLCAANLTLLGSAAWDAPGVRHLSFDRSTVADITRTAPHDRPSHPAHVVGGAEQGGALASQR